MYCQTRGRFPPLHPALLVSQLTSHCGLSTASTYYEIQKRSLRTSEAEKAQHDPQRSWLRIGWMHPDHWVRESKLDGTVT